MFKGSVCPFATEKNVDVCEIDDGFDVDRLIDEVCSYEDKISRMTRGKLAKCFLLPDYLTFSELQDGVNVFNEVLNPFANEERSSVVGFPDVGVFYWFVVSNLYPENYFRYSPKNMVLFTSNVFFPSIEDEEVFYFTLNKAVEKSLRENLFSLENKPNHRLCENHQVLVGNYKRLILTAIHGISEPDNFHELCLELKEKLSLQS